MKPHEHEPSNSTLRSPAFAKAGPNPAAAIVYSERDALVKAPRTSSFNARLDALHVFVGEAEELLGATDSPTFRFQSGFHLGVHYVPPLIFRYRSSLARQVLITPMGIALVVF